MIKPVKKERIDDGKIIQKHLENHGMDPWYIIYQGYVNPYAKSRTKQKD